MARLNVDNWLPEPQDSQVMTRVQSVSAIERAARRIPMNSETRLTPRSGGVDVDVIPKGGIYAEDATAGDVVTLVAKKFGKAIRIAEEDLDDSLVDVIKAKQIDWASSYARMLDHACIGNTGAGPFESIYNEATTAGNVVTTGGAVTYTDLSDAIGSAETGNFYSPDDMVVIAHPSFKGQFRGLLDGNNAPVFAQSLTQGTPDALFGVPVFWSAGARKDTAATDAPTGNPLLVVANRNYLLLGVRSGPESIFIDGRNGLGALTDESILKMRARRAFAVGQPESVFVLEKTDA